ncbi:hypothetical protein [Pseudohaliea rubra]|uniref:Putative lipoprotein n=1 Tax=Pseudohaliea rubra DSM 19751 TaxID=1265313 RepID=A0A095WYH5_9GAMM|nr:hypothetical protein [Pseudohaliea rubra]KGE03669.1 putative lipoprotein [Pseudohaliea rubra DSM 19751]
MRPRISPLLLLVALLLGGCGGYEFRNIAKSDIDLVTDEFIDETRGLMQELAEKLYARNPAELRKVPGMTVERRLQLLRDTPGALVFPELGGRTGIVALEVVFNPAFDGDRVFALVAGLGGMLRQAYGYNTQTYLLSEPLEPEALRASARNIEILLWRLRHTRHADGRPFLVTSEYRGVVDNLSFERLFGKLIALQDMMARIAGDAGDRRVTRAVHAASSMFIPLPL